MSAPAALPLFGDAYLADTQHLTLEEHGAYFKLLIICWRTEACELPADPKRIATMLGISAGKWAKLSPAVMAFWTRSETGWFQKRLTKERAFVDGKIAKNTLAANARWAGKPLETNKVDDADAYAPAMPLSPPPIRKEVRTNASALDGKPSCAEPVIEPIDLKAVLFSTGPAYLKRHGLTDANSRAMLGKWRKEYGDGAVIDALAAAQSEACSDPIPMITRILETRNVRSMGRNDRLPADKPGNVRTVAALDLVRQFGTAAQRNQPGDCGPDRNPRPALSAWAR